MTRNSGTSHAAIDRVEEANHRTYVLITPARNEAAFIEQTIRSVVRQTVRPAKWVIVSDGSTDGTDDIVKKFASEHNWIEFVRMPGRKERHFAGKVHAFRAGFARVKDLNYNFIGSLDADITFDGEYFSFLLGKLAENPKLGLAGTPFREGNAGYDYRFVSIEHVSGACQLFRRECFEAIGGYTPMKGGGVDHVAVVTARMKGWQTRTFTEKVCEHHREIGSAGYNVIMAKYKVGRLDYALGAHPIWELFRSAYQLTKRPFILGGVMILAGYCWSMIRRMKRPVSTDFVQFRRREQMQRLRRLLTERLSSRAPTQQVPRLTQTLKPEGEVQSPSPAIRCQYQYVLITAARDEAAYIEKTLQSVVSQTIQPLRWIIVSDGSTDGTDDIIKKYAAEHEWIELLQMPERRERNFAGKAHGFNAGYAKVKQLEYDFIANVDGDVSFDKDFFSYLLSKFAENPGLGMAGTRFTEDGNSTYDYRFVSLEHVSGQCQVFRRECLEAIGGYLPVKAGGVDLIAVITAQMKGWQTRTFTEKFFKHHRVMGTASNNLLKVKFRIGQEDYAMGGHPVWEMGRVLYQMGRRPLLIGGCMILAGYAWSGIRRTQRPVSREFVKFRRRGQLQRLKRFFSGRGPSTKTAKNNAPTAWQNNPVVADQPSVTASPLDKNSTPQKRPGPREARA